MSKYFIKVSLTYTLYILFSNLQTKLKFEQDFCIMGFLRIETMYNIYFLAKGDNEAYWVYFLFGYLILFPQPAPVSVSLVCSALVWQPH